MCTLKGGKCSVCGVYFSNSLRLSNHEFICYKNHNKRHTCIICKCKRYERYMNNVFGNSWACNKPKYHFSLKTCCEHEDIGLFIKIIEDVKNLKVLKLSYLDLVSCHSRTDNSLS